MCYQYQDVCDSLHGKVRRGEFGDCLTIERLVVVDLSLPSKVSSQHALLSELRLIFGIGSSHNQRLREEGYNSIPSLLTHPRWKEAASTFLDRWERPLNPAQVHATLLHWLPTSHPLFLHLLSLIPRARLLFFDLETLGLGGAPIILAAMARPSKEGIRITQYLARSLDEEIALLEQINQEIVEASLLLSYNGKAFDWAVLQERFAYYGLRPDHLPLHIDLLHHARRAFRNRLPDLRLGTVEERLLGIRREEDLPSEAVPEYYSAYLESGNPGPLVPIVNHNRQDVETLALLLNHLLRLPDHAG